MTAYYNEHDPYAAQWLRNLILEGVIPAGEVDERSIVDVRANDLRGFRQCHFFAGIGGWAYALRLAEWPDDRPVWTGSCPCQPFSGAGKRKGTADERHLWPSFYNLICECTPPIVIGEQVASRDALAWWDIVSTDLEAANYACGAIDLSAAGVGAPHIRQRLFWMADSQNSERRSKHDKDSILQMGDEFGRGSSGVGGVAYADEGERGRIAVSQGREHNGATTGRNQGDGKSQPSDSILGVAEPYIRGRQKGRAATKDNRHGHPAVADGRADRTSPTNRVRRDADWLLCRDGKWRPVESGTFPLADGLSVNMGFDGPGENPYRQAPPSRVGMLRGYGNAIVPELAATFIRALVGA